MGFIIQGTIPRESWFSLWFAGLSQGLPESFAHFLANDLQNILDLNWAVYIENSDSSLSARVGTSVGIHTRPWKNMTSDCSFPRFLQEIKKSRTYSLLWLVSVSPLSPKRERPPRWRGSFQQCQCGLGISEDQWRIDLCWKTGRSGRG